MVAILPRSRAPAATSVINAAVAATYLKAGRRVARSDRTFNLAMPPTHREAEWAFSMEEVASVQQFSNQLPLVWQRTYQREVLGLVRLEDDNPALITLPDLASTFDDHEVAAGSLVLVSGGCRRCPIRRSDLDWMPRKSTSPWKIC